MLASTIASLDRGFDEAINMVVDATAMKHPTSIREPFGQLVFQFIVAVGFIDSIRGKCPFHTWTTTFPYLLERILWLDKQG